MKRFRRVFAIIIVLALLCPVFLGQKVSAAEDKSRWPTLAEAAEGARKKLANQSKKIQARFYLDDPREYVLTSWADIFLEEVYKHTGVPDEGDYLKWSFQGFGSDAIDEFDGQTHYVTVTIENPRYNADADQEKELDEKLAQVMDSLDLEGKSDLEKITAIYRYICENVHYSPEVLIYEGDPLLPSPDLNVYYSAYGALVLNRTTCQGYASLVYRMMLEAGIDCRMIAGDNHGWNIVKLDGKYYYLDATDDEGHVDDPQCFLKGSASFRENGHKSWHYQFNREFLDEYPISVLDYWEEDLSAGGGSEVLKRGTCGDGVSWELTADGHLVVSGSGSMWNKDAYNWELWSGYNDYIKTVEIQPGVTHIGDYAFYNCPVLEEITIADTVTSVGRDAFALCENLREITLPDSVRTVGARAFYQCVRLETAVLSSSMTTIPEEMFIGCKELKTVRIPEGIRRIDEAALAVCPSLREFTLPESLKELGTGVFSGSIDPDAKVSLTLPESIISVGWACFEDSGLYELIWNARTGKVGIATIHQCYYLEKLSFGDGVTEIEEAGIGACCNLKELKLPSKLKKLGRQALSYSSSLEEIVLPESLEEVGTLAFGWCSAIKEIEFPASLKTLGENPFGRCTQLETITFRGSAPKHVEGDLGILNDQIMREIFYPQDDPTWTQEYRDRLATENVTWRPAHAPGAEHTFAEYQGDEENHWSVCVGCSEKYDVEPHQYASDCAHRCEVCSFSRTAPHRFSDEWTYDEELHWHDCADCDSIKAANYHQFDEGVYDWNIRTYTCQVCGYVYTEEVELTPELIIEQLPNSEYFVPVIGAVVAAVVVLTGLVITIVVLAVKKKKKAKKA